MKKKKKNPKPMDKQMSQRVIKNIMEKVVNPTGGTGMWSLMIHYVYTEQPSKLLKGCPLTH